MDTFDRRKHWENIYHTKELTTVSWYQPTPETSLEFFRHFDLPLTAKIIDIGGGDSYLVDHLITMGYEDISVLDISAAAIDRAKRRLGDRAKNVNWIIADAATFQPDVQYDFWHDRAAFHFLTDEREVSSYLENAHRALNPNGLMVIGTFSVNGPEKCSGIPIKQYSEKSMTDRLKNLFEKMKCKTVDHTTPSKSVQQFIFCSFKKISATASR